MRSLASPGFTLDPDAGLVDGCKSGDISAYEHLYRTQGARMKSVAFHMLGDYADAEDAVQEAFIKIYRNVGRFKGESTFATWIYRVLMNACYDLMRKRSRRRMESAASRPDPDPVRAIPSPDRDHPLRLTIEESIQRLPQRNRIIFLLFEIEGFKHSEIAEILKIPEGTSKNLLFEARKALQRTLIESRWKGCS